MAIAGPARSQTELNIVVTVWKSHGVEWAESIENSPGDCRAGEGVTQNFPDLCRIRRFLRLAIDPPSRLNLDSGADESPVRLRDPAAHRRHPRDKCPPRHLLECRGAHEF